MKINCLGAVRTVTGSCFQLENPEGGLTLLDCGLFQGGRQTEMRNYNTTLYRPDEIRAVVITHAHMDHSGLVPRLVRAGYRGPVFATQATTELLKILWQDAAGIQEHEAIWKSRKNGRQGRPKVEPLYSQLDAEKASALLVPLPLETESLLAPGLKLTLYSAGHILGAASAHFTLEHNEKKIKILFSGDLGRSNQLLLPPPKLPPEADYIFMETTYGNRRHKDLDNSIEELVSIINQAYREGGKVLIPAFAVERTQEIIFLLAQAWHEGLLPKNMPVILDSPLAIAASEVYIRHPQLFDDKTKSLLSQGYSPLTMPTLSITHSMEDSQKINQNPGPAIILAGSGMANAGRILHHFKHNIWRENCHVIFVGFQAQGTTGRRLVEGANIIKIFREPLMVKAKIHTIGGFSGHADQDELVEWLRPQIHPNLTVNLIHGEEASTLAFEEKLKGIFPNLKTRVPFWRESIDLLEGKIEVPPLSEAPVDIPPDFKAILGRMASIRQIMDNRKNPLAPNRLAQLEEILTKAEEIFLSE